MMGKQMKTIFIPLTFNITCFQVSVFLEWHICSIDLLVFAKKGKGISVHRKTEITRWIHYLRADGKTEWFHQQGLLNTPTPGMFWITNERLTQNGKDCADS